VIATLAAAFFRADFDQALGDEDEPTICTHSETMLPTTWPHLLSAFIDANRNAQPIPVIPMNIKSECRYKNRR